MPIGMSSCICVWKLVKSFIPLGFCFRSLYCAPYVVLCSCHSYWGACPHHPDGLECHNRPPPHACWPGLEDGKKWLLLAMEVTWKFYKNDGETLISPQQGHELSGRQIPPVMQGPFINVTQSLHHLFRLTPGWSFWNTSQSHVRITCWHHLSLPPSQVSLAIFTQMHVYFNIH